MIPATWSDAEVTAELVDMEEHVPFSEAARDRAYVALAEQTKRTVDVYGADETKWMAQVLHGPTGIIALREAAARADDTLAGDVAYRDELRAETARRRNT